VRRFSLRREIAIGLGVYALYVLVSRVVLRRDGRARARRNAERVVAVEEALGLHVEPALQRHVLRAPRLVHGLNLGYAVFNVGLTVGWLVHLYRRRAPHYHAVRRACVLAHVGAQPAFLLFPAGPPRGLDGFVDTLSVISGVDLEHPLLVRFYNPLAAMPSLHVAFAVVTGSSIAASVRSRPARAAARGYAPLVALVVTATGNHYVLDSAAGAALGVAARRLAGRPVDAGGVSGTRV
jgi:hypothetical protein